MTGTYVFPASYAQERLWFLARLDPDVPAHHVNGVFELSGPSDPERCLTVLRRVVARHETLRTSLTVEDGDLVQVVQVDLPVTLPCTDLRGLPPERAEDEFRALAAAEARRPFALDRPPLWRARLVRMRDDLHRIVLVVHHAVFDARSAVVLARELEELHDALAEGREPVLPELPIQYADYAAWQREHLAGGVLEAQLGYWRERLAGLPGDTGLPTDRPRPAARGHAGAEYACALPPGLAEALEELARRRGATLFMVLLAGFKALLARWGGGDDVVAGTPVAGRDLPEFEPVIGMFVNTLVLRTDLSGDPSFDELLDRVRGTVLEALDHADVPFDRLVEALRPARDPSRTPLYQIGFNLLPMDSRGQFPNGTAQQDLGLDVVRTPSGASLYFEYSTELYDAGTVERLAEAYRLVLEAVVADPAVRLSRLPLMTPEREREVLTAWNATAAPYPERALHELVAEQAARTPGAVAVRDLSGGGLTYAELDARVGALAGRLAAAGVGPGTCVALCLPRDPALIVALLAVLRAGGHYLPLDPAYPAERLTYLLSDSGAGLLITDSRLAADLPGGLPRTLLLDRPAEDAPPAPPVRVSPDDLAYLIYTSGSTGRPKGVEVPHRGVVNLVTDVVRRLGGGSALLMTSLSFDIAALEIFTPLLSGGTLVVAPDDASRVPREAGRAAEGVDLVQLTPSVAGLIADHLPPGLPRAILGGEPLPVDLAARLLKATGELWNFYGPTETTIWSTAYRVPADAATML
ncbi:condensation domain-containing protein, partial [Nonomuraea sp. MCN248]